MPLGKTVSDHCPARYRRVTVRGDTRAMTLTTLIAINAILGAAAIYGIVSLLAFGIHSDRIVHKPQVRSLRHSSSDRLAA